MKKFIKKSTLIGFIGLMTAAFSFQSQAHIPLNEQQKQHIMGDNDKTEANYNSIYAVLGAIPTSLLIAGGTLISVATIYGYKQLGNGRWQIAPGNAGGGRFVANGHYNRGLIRHFLNI